LSSGSVPNRTGSELTFYTAFRYFQNRSFN
jgi:hypothetical protein